MTRRLAALATAAVIAVAATACIPFDFRGPFDGADLVWVDDDGTWWIIGDPDPLWDGPADGIAVAGDYDGNNRTEPAAYVEATGMWHTAGARGTFHFPAPADPNPVTTSALVTPVPADYDGDGDTDPAWFVDDTATWHIEGQAPIQFGRPTSDPTTPYLTDYGDALPFHDIPVPADHDGDGDDDLAVYRLETGEIHILGEAEPLDTDLPYGRPAAANLDGQPGDEFAVLSALFEGWWVEGVDGRLPTENLRMSFPAVGDYDGDGTADLGSFDELDQVTWEYTVPTGTVLFPVDGWVAPNRAGNIPPALVANLLVQQYLAEECLGPIEDGCPETHPVSVELATGHWFERDGYNSNPVFTGPAGSVPVSGDYDGDGTVEHAAYDPATGDWVTDGALGTFTRPAPPDIDTDPTTGVLPVPGDYDGDGDTDPAFFRDADATWWIDGAPPVTFGRPTSAAPTFDGRPIHDIPIPGDFNGDGRTELATYRIDTGEFTFQLYGTIDPGWPPGDPVIGDFDDDGADNAGLWDDNNGTEGTFRYGTQPPTTPYPGVTGHPIAAPWQLTGGDQLAVLTRGTGTSDDWHLPDRTNYWETLEEHLDRTEGMPAVGDYALYANRDFITAYVDYCIDGTPDPGECT